MGKSRGMDHFLNTDINVVRAFWDAMPCNIRHSPRKIASKEYFDEVEYRKYHVEYHIPGFADFNKWKGKRVLEIGCGIGTDTINFARGGARVTAVDLSEKSLFLAKKRAKLYGFKDVVRFYHANAEQLSRVVPVEAYDLVYAFGVVHHTPRPESVLKEIKKYMSQKSTLKIMVYHRNSWKVLWILAVYGKGAFWKADRLIAQYSEAQTGCPVTYAFSKKSVKKLLNGFYPSEIRIHHIFPYKISEYVRYEYKKAAPFRWLPDGLFKRLENILGWHLCVTALKSAE